MKRLLSWKRTRVAIQLLSLFLFLWLFLQTEYRGLDELAYPVGLLFRIDPLAAIADALAPGAFGWHKLWPALVLLLLTALVGRFFCGWVCPLGTTLDGAGRLVGRGRAELGASWRRSKYALLLALIVAALLGVQLLGLFDPLSIFLRSLTLALYPAFNLVLSSLFDFFHLHRVPLITSALDGIYPFVRDHLLAFNPPSFTLALFTLLIFLGIVLLEKVERRFWCRNLCPLGALLGLCSRWSLLQRRPSGQCADCAVCVGSCRMGAASPQGQLKGECLLCLDCAEYCPQGRVSFRWGAAAARSLGPDLQRRTVFAALATGALVAPVARMAPASWLQNPYLLRPPGAVAEDDFLRRCIRCGECMKVCIGRALHPAFAQAGAVGLWTPLLVARLGYCEYNCTLCGQVCPTGAIARLQRPEKQKTVIGLAVFDRNRCLPYARGEECLVCEEHCPTGEKAIVFDPRTVETENGPRSLKVPRVISRLCIGCGICETRCPLDGQSAIRVVNEGESRRPRDMWS